MLAIIKFITVSTTKQERRLWFATLSGEQLSKTNCQSLKNDAVLQWMFESKVLLWMFESKMCNMLNTVNHLAGFHKKIVLLLIADASASTLVTIVTMYMFQ